MIIFKNLLYLLLFFSFSAFAQESREDLSDKANSLYEAKEYKASILLYNKLLALKPNNSYYLTRKGLCYFKLEDYQKAKENFRLSILYEDPTDKEALATNNSNLSACYSVLGEDKKAYEYALKAYRLDETNPLTLFNAASLGNNVKEYRKGIELMDNAKIEKHNDFNALYGRAYLSLKEYEKSIEYYEKFFNNFDENNRYAERINILDEKCNLWYAYMGLLHNNIENKIDDNKNKDKILNLTKELSTTTKNKNLVDQIFYIINDTKGNNNYFADMFIQQFEMLPNAQPLEKAILYYRTKNFEKSQVIIEKLIQEKAYYTDIDKNLVKMYQYLNELNLMLMKTDKQVDTVDEKTLERSLNYFRAYYLDKKNIDYETFNTKEELFNPIYETLIILNSTNPYTPTKVKYILGKIFDNIPNEKMKTEMLEMLKNTFNKK
jgi:tetratricopeptide (TPR) repeat protein